MEGVEGLVSTWEVGEELVLFISCEEGRGLCWEEEVNVLGWDS